MLIFFTAPLHEPSYWHRMLAPDVLPNWILMAVGIIGVLIGIFTLIALYRQGGDTQRALTYAKQSADAALLNAQAVMNAERAWVMVDISDPVANITVTNATNPDRTMSSVRFSLSYRNEGRTPCWIVEKCIWFKIVDKIPAHPVFEEPTARYDSLEPLLTTYRPSFIVSLTCEGELVVSLSTVPVERRAGSNTPIIYGYIKYRDTFSTERETRFGYRTMVDGTLVRIKSTAYNNHT